MSLRSLKNLLLSLSFFTCTSVFAVPLVVDISGVQSHGEFGDPENTVLTYDVGANSTITGVSFSINVTAYRPSWLSELGLAFTNSKVTDGIVFNPGINDWFPGTATYSDAIDLREFNLAFNVGNDGLLRLEFFEDYDDFQGADGQWNFGTITFDIEPVPQDVPEPATALLLGAGAALMGYAGRRRRSGGRGAALAAH